MKDHKHIKSFNEATEKSNIPDDRINEIHIPKEDIKMYDLLTTFFGSSTGEVLSKKIGDFVRKMKKKDKD